MSEIKVLSEKEAMRLSVDAITGEINLALEKLEFLTALLDEEYLTYDWNADSFCDECKQREMFIVNAMMQDYLEDIREAKDMLEDEFDL